MAEDTEELVTLVTRQQTSEHPGSRDLSIAREQNLRPGSATCPRDEQEQEPMCASPVLPPSPAEPPEGPSERLVSNVKGEKIKQHTHFKAPQRHRHG